MVKQASKSTLTRKLDSVVSRITRSIGVCVKCGNADYSKLQCAHIYSRTYRSVRWDLKNVLCLCASCHFYFHKNPIEFGDFVKNYLGEYEYIQLSNRRNSIIKYNTAMMQELLTVLTLVEENILGNDK